MRGEVIRVSEITGSQRDRMYELMDAYFEGVTRDAFEADLKEKQWAVLLTDGGRMQGFSTLCLMEDAVCGRLVRAFFSGDTIIDRSCWGSMALENAWAAFVFSQAAADPECMWYWFLVCKGYRTYRYLPAYFKRYSPSPNHAVSDMDTAVLERLASSRFGESYCPETGTIHVANDYRLRAGVGDITEKELRDPRIAFFQERNPGWRDGVELACLAELSPSNLTDAALRFLRKDHIL